MQHPVRGNAMRSQQRGLWTLIVLVSIVLLSLGSSVWADNHKYGGKLVVAHGADHRGLEPLRIKLSYLTCSYGFKPRARLPYRAHIPQ